jgi:type II restriction/modification system DNA methylase subunit YeeA
MNRNKLKAYAQQARRDFIKAVTDRAASYGLMKEKIEPITEQGDVAIIAGNPFPRSVAKKRKSLEERVRQQGFDQFMEAMAYTWFNRFVAIRFMELHGYLGHGYRVLSHPEGGHTPEILEHAEHVDLPGIDKEQAIELKLEGTKEPELYHMLLIAQCNALHRAMPFLFEEIGDSTELLLPENLLHSDSLIRKLVDEIPEEEWQAVEIIGWLYQFYISEKKDQVIGKVVKSEDIPAATQLFTPNWIVKYMIQNTLGRQWVATYPDSPLKQHMEYYIEPAEQTPEVQEQLQAITPNSLNPEELTLLDPACGSGHILVEAYDLLKAIYQERGYRAKDIPRLILEKNLFGLEIDDRAAQLAAFALMMKAREDDRRIFENGAKPHVIAIHESKGLDAENITLALNAPILKTELPPREFLFEEMEEAHAPLFSRKNLSVKGDIDQADVAQLIHLFEHGKTFGSLIRMPEELAKKLPAIMERVRDVLVYGNMLGKNAAQMILPVVNQADMLARKYDAVVTNPPYMGNKGMNGTLKAFAQANYPDSKTDLYAFFVERLLGLVRANCFVGLMTPFTWMFLSSFEKFRARIVGQNILTSLIRPEYHAFFESAYVPICTFVLKAGRNIEYQGVFIDLSEFYGMEIQRAKTLEAIKNTGCAWRYTGASRDFQKIPGTLIVYWLGEFVLKLFAEKSLLGNTIESKMGVTTGDNERFLRFWFEPDISEIGFGLLSPSEARTSKKRWFPCNKGGEFRRWYGNQLYIIDWEMDGDRIRNFRDINGKPLAFPRNTKFYFRPSCSWSLITSSLPSFRFFAEGFVFDQAGPSAFCEDESHLKLIGAFLNSFVGTKLLKALNPTLNFPPGVVANMPFSDRLTHMVSERASAISREAINYCCADWDSFEISWNFKWLPLLNAGLNRGTLEASWEKWKTQCVANIAYVKKLEEVNNNLFIHAYGLEKELAPEVPLEQITLTVNPKYRYGSKLSDEELKARFREDTIKELFSYGIGCMMGRYSLDKPGLIYAHSGNVSFDPGQYKTFSADQDGIIPVTDIDWFPDDAGNRLIQFISVAWPKEHLEENLTFIAESLGQNSGESPRETIRRYLATGFYKHHLAIYKRRPIYWLFSSGKQRAFHCLVYLHRYNEGTLSRMRTEYVIPLQGKMNARIEQLKADIPAATSTTHRKKLEKERERLLKQQPELYTFDEKLRHYADKRISLDLDDGVKVNYGKFGDLLAEVKAVTGKQED